MEELKEYTNDVLYENYRTEKLTAMGIQQDPTVFKEVEYVTSYANQEENICLLISLSSL